MQKQNVLLAVLKISTCSGYLFNGAGTVSSLCFYQDQYCSCSQDASRAELLNVKCFAQNLTQFPNFTKMSDQIIDYYKDFYIYLNENELTKIPSGVFWNFNRANRNEYAIYLILDNNKISIIENAAFAGINNMDVGIGLKNNRITALPLAFQLLHKLTALEINGNPILAFDSATVNPMANSLVFLNIDYDALVFGNKELSVLHNIIGMTIYDIPSDYGNLPFLFFRNTVSDMQIKGTELTTLPCSLIDGPKVKYFYIHYAKNISANSVFDCQPGTRLKVFDLVIMNSSLQEFPDILNITPSLLALNVVHNKISSINEKFIPLHNKMQVLNLSYNRLRTIPAVFRRFDNLRYLYIEHNEITSVAPESNVLSIVSLCAAGNPWWYNNITCYNYYEGPFNFIDNTMLIG